MGLSNKSNVSGMNTCRYLPLLIDCLYECEYKPRTGVESASSV